MTDVVISTTLNYPEGVSIMTTHARFLKAQELFGNRAFREAIVELKLVLQADDSAGYRGEAIELLARANYGAAYLPEAERLAREMIADNPTHSYAHTLLVRSLQRQSKTEEADRAMRLADAVGATY